jgi:glycosyltransferase involved in cell wall biosynthesis
MSIILIGPGYKPIPPVGWGAVECIVWDYYENLQKMGYNVQIINTTNLNEILNTCNFANPYIVHIMYDDYALIIPHLTCKKILYTSHYAYLTEAGFPENRPANQMYYKNIVKKLIENSSLVTINAISQEISDVYTKLGFTGKINIYPNGARENLFNYVENPQHKHKSIYLGKVEIRKKQYKYQSIHNIDFVGNYHDSPFDITNPNYLGEWDKKTLYENLTQYANLLLLSDGDADPLVVKEALMAGLGIVVSECSAANLDNTKPFITIISNDKLDDMQYIRMRIIENRMYSVAHRQSIRDYAIANFSWATITRRYANEFLLSIGS